MTEAEFWDLDFRRLSALAQGRTIDQGGENDERPEVDARSLGLVRVRRRNDGAAQD
mgnify:CR=1 FL=1